MPIPNINLEELKNIIQQYGIAPIGSIIPVYIPRMSTKYKLSLQFTLFQEDVIKMESDYNNGIPPKGYEIISPFYTKDSLYMGLKKLHSTIEKANNDNDNFEEEDLEFHLPDFINAILKLSKELNIESRIKLALKAWISFLSNH